MSIVTRRGAVASMFVCAFACVSLADDPPVPRFAPAVQVSAAQVPQGVVTADFDGDGDADWATYDVVTSNVKIRRNDGTGLVYSSNGFGVQYGVVDMAVGDFDHDGRPDLALATYGGVVVARNLGVDVNGTLQFAVAAALPRNEFPGYSKIATGDYDGDLADDVVATGDFPYDLVPGRGVLSVYLSDGAGGFRAPVDRTYAAEIPAAVAMGDLTGDGRAEIVMASLEDRLHVYFNPHTTSVDVSEANDSDYGVNVQIGSIVIADVTRDGRKDIVAVGMSPSTPGGHNVSVEIYPTDAAPVQFGIFHSSWGFVMADVAGTAPTYERDVCAVADLNGDGFPEIVATYGRANLVAVLPLGAPTRLPNGDVDTLSSAVFPYPTFPAGTSPARVAAADVNGDGKTDLLVVGTGATAALLINDTGAGGGGGNENAYPAAAKLAVKSKAFPGGRFQDGQKFTFTCEQAATDVHVRLQSTETPADEESWADLPLAAFFAKGKGASVKWTLAAKHVPAGNQYFRTVTSGPALEDGVNSALPTSGRADRYIGPFDVLSKGAVLVFSTQAYPGSDYDTRTTTHTGDLVTYVTTVRNSGNEPAVGVVVRMPLPVGATLDELYTTEGWRWLDAKKRTKIEWDLPTLAAKATAYFAMTVHVTATDGVLSLFDVGVVADTGRSLRDGAGTLKLTVTKPIRLEVRAVRSSTTAGGLQEYDLTAKNLGGTTLFSAVAWDRLPTNVAFELGYFVNAAGDPVVSPVAAPAGRSNAFYERSSGKVFWYLGDMAPGQVHHLRLVTRVRYDQRIGNEIVNGAYELRGCSPGRTGCDPLRMATLDLGSPGPHDVRTAVEGPAPSAVPVLRLGGKASGPLGATLYEPRYGHVAVVSPAEEVKFSYTLGNSGGVVAKGVHLQGNLPNDTTFVADSVTIRTAFGAPTPLSTYTISNGGSLDVDVGNVGGTLVVAFRVLVAAGVKDRTMLVARDFHLTTDALEGIVWANPSPLNVLVALPYVPAVETHAEIAAGGAPVHEGDTISFFTTYANVGGRPGSGELVQTVPEGCSFLDATFFAANDFSIAFFDEHGAPVGDVVPGLTLKPTKKKLLVSLGELAAGASGKARFRFTVAKAPKSGVLETQAALGGKVAFVPKAGGKIAPTIVPPTTFNATLRVETDSTPQLFLVRVAPHVVRTKLEFAYTCIVGNTSDHAATNVVMSMDAPPGTRPTATQGSVFGDDGRVRGRTATWTIGTLAAHSVEIRDFQLIVDDDAGASANALVEDSLFVKASNAVGWRLAPQASLLLVPDLRFETYAWPSVTLSTSAIGMVLGSDLPAGLDDAVRALHEDSASVMSCGTDMTQFTNGAFVARIGDDLAFAFGNKSDVSASSGSASTYGATRVVLAPPGAITISGIPGREQTTGLAALTTPLLFVDAGVANLVVGGSFTQVARDGRTLLGSAGAPIGLVELRLPTTLEAGAEKLVAAGGGNVVPTGAGHLVGNDGASLVGNDGASLVAAGGGNLVAAGGGNLIGNDGGTLVAAGAGNLAAKGGAPMVAAGGMNVVPTGGGN
jgi:uncharacterized repeat protein (TIGR01451 family)